MTAPRPIASAIFAVSCLRNAAIRSFGGRSMRSLITPCSGCFSTLHLPLWCSTDDVRLWTRNRYAILPVHGSIAAVLFFPHCRREGFAEQAVELWSPIPEDGLLDPRADEQVAVQGGLHEDFVRCRVLGEDLSRRRRDGRPADELPVI